MNAKRQFPENILAVLRENKGLRLRAGKSQHRFIGIWVVVVKDRAFIRSWSVKPNGWYQTFLKEPYGTIQVGDHEIAVRAVHIKGLRLRDAIDLTWKSTTRQVRSSMPRISEAPNPKPRPLS